MPTFQDFTISKMSTFHDFKISRLSTFQHSPHYAIFQHSNIHILQHFIIVARFSRFFSTYFVWKYFSDTFCKLFLKTVLEAITFSSKGAPGTYRLPPLRGFSFFRANQGSLHFDCFILIFGYILAPLHEPAHTYPLNL